MTTENTHNVLIGRSDDGFIAASLGNPYFFFEAASEEALDQKISRALRFYYETCAEQARTATPPRPRTLLRPFATIKSVPLKQFAAA